jgi:hypothetical protein
MKGMRSLVLLTPLGTGLVSLSVSAPADIVTVTFTGIVGDSAYDLDGTFGCTGDACGVGAYKGDTYRAVFTFNTSIGAIEVDPGEIIYLFGGSSQSGQPASPLAIRTKVESGPPRPKNALMVEITTNTLSQRRKLHRVEALQAAFTQSIPLR